MEVNLQFDCNKCGSTVACTIPSGVDDVLRYCEECDTPYLFSLSVDDDLPVEVSSHVGQQQHHLRR